MLQTFAEDHEWIMIGSIVFFFTAVAVGISWLLISKQTRPFFERYEGIVPPFLSLPAVLFSLTVALMATSIWENYSMANKSVRSESLGLETIVEIAESVPSLKEGPLASYAKNYARSIINDEWVTLSTHGSPSTVTRKQFEVLRHATFEAIDALDNNAQAKVLTNAFQLVNDSRKTRLSFVSFDTHPLRWYASIVLAVLVQLVVALVHIPKPHVLPLVMGVTTLTILLPMCTIAVTLSNPYVGMISISNSPLQAVLSNIHK